MHRICLILSTALVFSGPLHAQLKLPGNQTGGSSTGLHAPSRTVPQADKRRLATPQRGASPPAPAARPPKPSKPVSTPPTQGKRGQPGPSKGAVPTRSTSPVATAPQGEQSADYIVAVVNSEPITNNEVRARAARAARDMRQQGAEPPSDERLRAGILDQLITERAELQYARDAGISVDEQTLEQAELAIARQNQLPDVETLYAQLAHEGIAVSGFRRDVRNQVVMSRLRQIEIEPKLKITDADVERFIREQTGVTDQNFELNLAMILIEVPTGSTTDEKARLKSRAQDVARRAGGGQDFAKLAVEYSDAINHGGDGGELGLRPLAQYPDLFVEATRQTPVGKTTGPVQSDAGWHILKVLERRADRELPEVRIPMTHVRHIVLHTGTTQSVDVARQRAADFKRRAESGQTSFAELASKNSDDASADDGGDLGWLPPGQFGPELDQIIGNLDAGEISDPIVAGDDAVHLFQVEERREQVLTSEQQRELARNVLREQKAQEAFETFSQDVRGRAYIEMRDPPT